MPVTQAQGLESEVVSLPCTLAEVPAGGRGQVVAIAGAVALRRRLFEMGLCTGTTIEVIRRAPFGDPIEIRLQGYHLSLRAKEAGQVEVLRVLAE